MMGTPGFSYGVEGIWQFNTEEMLFGVSPGGNVWGNVPWEEAYKYEGSVELGLGKKFLDQYDWWKLKPTMHRLESNGDDVGSVLFSAQIEEKYLFVFMFKKPARWRQYRINGFKEGNTYAVSWFNPITGDIIQDELPAGVDGVIILDNAPVMQDWVLVIEL